MLDFEIEAGDLQRLADELGAMPNEVRAAYNRALTRTAATLRKLSSKGLQSHLGLARAAAVRRRLKSLRIRGQGGMGSVRLWYGLNDLPVSEFRGRTTPRSGGAAYSGPAGSHRFDRAWIGASRYARKRTILQRVRESRYPIREAQLPIKDKADVFVEDEVFVKLNDIFWQHFSRDLERRVDYMRSR
ncbi:phage tail protein [Billgrantia antri]|uniref:Phage tail protein n=1 Tax=Halomonas sulfidivorans TaxID=2733488 RepID=A0ABX7WL38_9GAMM|nr:hypothetical protein [Halomonas sulfidivorans]QTP60924.1 phage tail protein [Halomonas sulfidivorans]